MSSSIIDIGPGSPAPTPPRRRRRLHVVLIASCALVLVVFFVVLAGIRDMTRKVPAFPSLAEHPDTSLQGTVAYFDGRTGCVRIIAAAGQPSKEVLCPTEQDLLMPGKDSKLVGPQLVWRSDGRLEVTMFRMHVPDGSGKQPTYTAGWQKLIDVRTGQTEDVPASALPSSFNTSGQPTVNARGERLTYTANSSDGRIKVVLISTDGSTRTLLSARGPGSYTYTLHTVFWAPNGQWIAADDGRILVITPGPPALTRVLVGQLTGGFDGPSFAVTGANLLTTSG